MRESIPENIPEVSKIEEIVATLTRDMEVLRQHWEDPLARRAYNTCRSKLESLRTRFKDVSLFDGLFSRFESMDAEVQEMEHARIFQEYEDKVHSIMEEVVSIEDAMEVSAKDGVNRAKLEKLHGWLDNAQEKLQDLDQEYYADYISPDKSNERKALMFLINRLRHHHPANRPPTSIREIEKPKSANLTAALNVHRQVREAYGKVSHRLNEEQRRSFRVRIAELSSLVRHARNEHARVVATQAIAHATELAPRLTWEALKRRL